MSAQATQFSQERLLQVLLAPQVSEKATFVADKNQQVIFFVTPTATKPEVKAAVEMLFKVQVKSVQISNLKGKAKRFGRYMGRRFAYALMRDFSTYLARHPQAGCN